MAVSTEGWQDPFLRCLQQQAHIITMPTRPNVGSKPSVWTMPVGLTPRMQRQCQPSRRNTPYGRNRENQASHVESWTPLWSSKLQQYRNEKGYVCTAWGQERLEQKVEQAAQQRYESTKSSLVCDEFESRQVSACGGYFAIWYSCSNNVCQLEHAGQRDGTYGCQTIRI